MPFNRRIPLAAATLAAAIHLLGSASPADPSAPIVSPVDELEVLDPRVDPEGKPRAVLERTPTGIKVEIPPTVVIHRYYYTGNRKFQGPMLPGGPTIVVVHHPRTGEQLNLTVQMLPGAPRIKYDRHEIVYDFGRRKMKIHFGLPNPLCGEPTPEVSYHCSGTDDYDAKATRPATPCHERLHAVGRIAVGATVSTVRILPFGTLVTEPVSKCQDKKALGAGVPDLNRGLEGTVRTVR